MKPLPEVQAHHRYNTPTTAKLTGIPSRALRDASKPDGTGEVPGVRVGRNWYYPGWFILSLILPPAHWAAQLLGLLVAASRATEPHAAITAAPEHDQAAE